MREVNINNNKGAVIKNNTLVMEQDASVINYYFSKKEDKPSLEKLQKMVDGYIQVVDAHNGDQIVMDEEGKLKNKPINYEATKHWIGENANAYDYVVGDAVILSGKARLS